MSKIIKIDDIQDGIRGTFLQKLSPEDLKRKIAESYLGVLTNDDTLANPFANLSSSAQDRVPEYLIWIMSQPEYFYFLIKVIFQMKTYPLQCLMLKELYTHKFPILLASRGAAKSWGLAMYFLIKMILTPGIKCVITGAGFRQAKIVFEYMEQIWKKSKMLQSCFPAKRDGPTHGTDVWTFRLGDSVTYALPVGPDGAKIRGFRANVLAAEEFACSRKSLVQTNLGLLKIEDIVENRIQCDVFNMDGELEPIIDYIKTPKTNVYKLTTKYNYEIEFSENHKFMTENGWKRGVDLTTNDRIIFDDNYKFPTNNIATYGDISAEDMAYLYGLLISEGSLGNTYRISIRNTDKIIIDDLAKRFASLNPKIYTKEAHTDDRGWKCKESYVFCINNKHFRDFLVAQGLSYNNVYNKEIPWAILQSNRICVANFLRGMFIGDGSVFLWKDRKTTKLGVAYYSVCEKLINQLHVLLKAMGYIAYKNSRTNHISKNKQWFLRLNGTYAADFAREINYPNIAELSGQLTPYKDRLRVRTGNVRISNNGQRFVTSVFNNNKTMTVGTFDTPEEAQLAIDEFYNSKKLSVQVKSVVKLDEQDHLYDISLPTTHSYYANGLVNHNSVNRAVFEEVMSGFLSVAASPVEQIEHNASIKTMKKLLIPISQEAQDSGIIENQLILSGTAYYKFNHFYQYFHKWREIIYTRGDKKKLRDILGADNDTDKFNWKDYSIIRVPVELIPQGFMDMDQINRTKASSSKDVYVREYACCLHPSTKILTTNGPKRIKDIRVGDMVLTHKGRFKKVNKLTYQKTDHLLEMKFYGNNKNLYITDNHPIYRGQDKFVSADKANTIVFSPVSSHELSNIKSVDLRDYVDSSEYNQYGDFIRSKHGSASLSNDQIQEVFKMFRAGSKKIEISKKLNIKYNIVLNTLNFSAFNKINSKIKVDYNLGLIFGYYSAEGCLSADGRSVSFCLDGHIDKKLTDMIDELIAAIKESFGIVAKKYYKKNTVIVAINNKIIASFIKKMCAGDCYNKLVNHNLLFSNEEFMEGFVVGFWNGDGHKRDGVSKSQICSENLMSQVRLVLSYFKIPNSYYTTKGGFCFFRNKKFINSNRFKLEMFKNNNNLFLNKFYNENHTDNAGQSKCYLNNDEIYYKLKSRRKIKFNGYVYNIEVDDDHSYHTEFGCVHNCFSDDSDGFFKRSLINSCTVNEFIPIIKGKEEVKFSAALYGDKTKKYIYGIDPAYQGDNFAIVILEVHDTHRRVVHSWTTQASDHKERLKAGVITENDYYHYCVKKIRSLMKRFPCAYIALDSDGGGKAIMEAFMDITKLETGEEMILPIINPEEKPKDTDFMQGDHILHVIKFTSDWITEANHALKKDMEAKDLIFPFHDSISYIEAEYYDESIVGDSKELYDTLDDCIYDIEELKNELSTITISETATGKERFDTPDIKTGIAKKGRLRKDRYSALLLANWIARTNNIFVTRATPQDVMTMSGAANRDQSASFLGNNKLAKALNDLYS